MNEAVQNNVCPDCGAPLVVGQARCWLCQRSTSEPASANPYASPRPLAEDNRPLEFSLTSLTLVITLVAVGLGAFWATPGLAVLLAVLGVPAFIRYLIATNRQKRAGATYTTAEKVGVFLVSLLIMSAVWMSAVVAFVVVCTAGALPMLAVGNENSALWVGGLGGLVSAIALAIWLLRVTAPPARPRQMER
jgi:hypothetical protein